MISPSWRVSFLVSSSSVSYLFLAGVGIDWEVADAFELELVVDFRSAQWSVGVGLNGRQRIGIDVRQKSTGNFGRILGIFVFKPETKGCRLSKTRQQQPIREGNWQSFVEADFNADRFGYPVDEGLGFLLGVGRRRAAHFQFDDLTVGVLFDVLEVDDEAGVA